MKAYKGTDKDLRCRGHQYVLGEEYQYEGEINVCASGFHACENPLDVLRYYPAYNGARYFEAECGGDIKTDDEDSNFACSSITLKTEIGLMGLIKSGVEAVFDKVKKLKPDQSFSGYQSTAATSGDQSTAATSGDWSTAATSGDQSTAATSGDQSTAVATGYQCSAIAQSKGSVAVANGYEARAKGVLGSHITVSEYDDDYKLLYLKSVEVDGKAIKADVFYMLKNGEFVEV